MRCPSAAAGRAGAHARPGRRWRSRPSVQRAAPVGSRGRTHAVRRRADGLTEAVGAANDGNVRRRGAARASRRGGGGRRVGRAGWWSPSQSCRPTGAHQRAGRTGVCRYLGARGCFAAAPGPPACAHVGRVAGVWRREVSGRTGGRTDVLFRVPFDATRCLAALHAARGMFVMWLWWVNHWFGNFGHGPAFCRGRVTAPESWPLLLSSCTAGTSRAGQLQCQCVRLVPGH
jgi:hypothetical protein